MRKLLVGLAATTALAAPVALAAPAFAASAPDSGTAASQPAGWVETGRFYTEAECVAAGSGLPLPPERWKCEQGPGYWGLWELR